ncbi:MAG TPA: porin [Solimonas sp.]|nr:porin [Solimonas sp.]
MNKNLLAIAVGAIFAIPSAAFADVKVYGKFNVGLESQKDEIGLDKKYTDNTWVFKDNNNSSRLGFKGDQDLGLGDLKIIYQLEYGIDPDGSEGSPFSERNIFVGLKGGFGTVQFGKYDTPVKKAGEKIDQFNDESLGDDAGLLVGETRQNNMIQYSTPKLFDALTVTAAVVPGEGRASVDDGDAGEVDKGLADTFYASIVYDSKMIYGSLSYAGNEPGGLKFDGVGTPVTKAIAYDVLRAAVYVAPITDLELGALYQSAQGVDQSNAGATSGDDAKEKSWLVSAGYSIEALKLKAQYGQTKGDISDLKRTEMAFGVDYKLSKAMTAQAYYVKYEQDAGTGSDPETSVAGLGLVYNF